MIEDDEMKMKAQDLINQVIQENKIKEEKIASVNTSNNISKVQTSENLNKEENPDKLKRKNTVINKRKLSVESNSSSDSDSQDSSPHQSSSDDKEKIIQKDNKKDPKKTSMISTDSSLENLMLSRDLNIKFFTLVSCLFCLGTTSLSIVGSLIFDRLLTFSYENKDKADDVIKEITMNHTMIYVLLGAIACFNLGILIMMALNNDHMLTKLILTELNWFFVLTQMAFGSLFLITLIWDTDLWTINVCLSISMLTILILAFYFTEIKQKKNMSKGTFVFIYIYISVLFSFISYVALYNISCILLENMEVQKSSIKDAVSLIIKIGINAGQTILSFVLLTYYKDVFFSFTSGYIEGAVFIHENFNLEKENIGLFVMVLLIVLGIILTIYRYRKKTFGYEDVQLEISKDFN
jgi:hypothetical protein